MLVLMGRKPMPGTDQLRTYLKPSPVLAAIAQGLPALAQRGPRRQAEWAAIFEKD